MSEEQILVREFQAEFAQVGDGRTVDVRVVPYNTPTEVSDFGGPTYRESWKPGVFDHQAKAANRVWLSFEHEQGLRGVIGHGVELVSREDGFYGSFRVLDGSDGDKALQMLDKKLLPGVSLEAIPHRSEKTPDGIVERIKATLKAVSLVRFPAFKEAQVLAVREGELPDEPDPAELTPDEPVPDPEPEGEPVPAARQFTHEEVEAVAASLERRSRVDELLERVGYEPIVKRAVTHKPWNGSAARFTDEQYQRSCLIDRGGDAPPKTRCSLPVLEPNGDVNANALGAAAARLNQLTGVTAAQKAAAARKLRRYYSQASMPPPPSVMAMAGRA
jgi:HK97 family phage prohead protease